jgi:sugar lactone lactonase YvrE
VAVVLAGTVAAGAAGLSAFGLRHAEPRDTGGGPAATAPATGANPVTGRQDREEVFEFAEKPKVTKEGDPSTSSTSSGQAGSGQGKWIITFTSKGKCDATVAIVDGQGKIVRHLASGVLGKNAPWPFKQDSLSQSVEWDGRDDAGKPAPAGCKVRVGLGLKAAYDKVIGWEPRDTDLDGFVCDAEGNLYVIKDAFQVFVFDRDGRYVRTVVPFPATTAPEKMLAKTAKTADGRAVPLAERPSGGYFTGQLWSIRTARQTPLLTPDGKSILLVNNAHRSGRYLTRLGLDPAVPETKTVLLNEKTSGEQQIGGVRGTGPLHMAMSPDGQWVYFGSPVKNGPHAVFRAKLTDLKTPAVFAGEVGKPGSDDAHFNGPFGVACDAAGNLYVGDNHNNRIQVFSPEGKLLRSIATEAPEQLAVHPKTGAIYVLRAVLNDDGMLTPATHALVKLDKDGKPVAELPIRFIRAFDARWPGVFCLDASAAEPVLWVYGGDGILKISDRGGKLETVLSLRDEVRKACPELAFVPNFTQIGLVADPYREQVYFPSRAGWARADGRTGRILGIVKGDIYEMAVGPDRLIYARLGNAGYGVVRFNPDDGKPVDFPKGTDTASRNRELSILGQPAKGIAIAAMGGNRTFQDGLCVAPNGDVWAILVEADGGVVEDIRKLGRDRVPSHHAYLLYLQAWGSDGAVKSLYALPGATRTGQGIRVARNGNVYLGLNAQPVGQKLPDGLAADSDCYKDGWGSLLRFDNPFDKFPIGVVNGPYEGKVTTPTHRGWSEGGGSPLAVEGLRWQYGGVSPATMKGCVCGNSRFGLDGFERAFVPAMQTFTVNALDANGNLIVRIGGYGNADSRGKDSPVIDPKTGLLRPKRADDPADLKPPKELGERIGFRWVSYVDVTDEALYTFDYNASRIVRCTLGYAAEETAPLP